MRVVVSGAGPVGLVAACTLAARGIETLVLEKREALSRASRASTWHPPTLEILDRFGVAQPLLDAAVRVEHVQYRDVQRGVLAEFAMATLAADTPFALRAHLEQADVTPMLLSRLQHADCAEVRFGAELLSVAQHEDRLALTVGSLSGARECIEASWLLVAEGAQSATRAALGVGFEGNAYSTRVLRLLTTTGLERVLPGLRPLSYLYRDGESISFLRMPECWRIILRIPAELPEATARGAAYYEPLLERWLGPHTQALGEVRTDLFSVGKRAARPLRRGRAILIGDAAHISTTRGGMNMNCGIHDAFAIATALADRIRSSSRSRDAEQRLDAAIRAREAIAQQLIARTDVAASGGAAWLQHVENATRSATASRDFLYSASMLDLAPEALGRSAASAL